MTPLTCPAWLVSILYAPAPAPAPTPVQVLAPLPVSHPAPAPRHTLRDSIRMANTIRQDCAAATTDATSNDAAKAAAVLAQTTADTSMAKAVGDILSVGGTAIDFTPDPVTGLADVYTVVPATEGTPPLPATFVVKGYPSIDSIPTTVVPAP
jgi:hypothetical protein